MTAAPPPDAADADTGSVSEDGDAEGGSDHIHLLVQPGENRTLLTEWLSGKYALTRSTSVPDPGTFDLCLVDETTFAGQAEALKQLCEGDVFRPVLLIGSDPEIRSDPTVWEYVDDLVYTPVKQAALHARIENLLERRRTSRDLAERERELSETVSELELTRQAIDAAPIGVTITDPDQPDNPTVYANAAFERLTGHDSEEVLGENMRLLQGPASDPDRVAAMREAIDAQEPVSMTLINYRTDGTQFWNRVDIAPVRNDSGRVTNYVGFQTDVTDQKIREQRLSVLNRLMRHNLSNNLNIVDGYADLLLDAVEDPALADAIEEIKTAAGNLQSLGEDARQVERLLDRCRTIDRSIDVDAAIEDVIADLTERYPDVSVSVDQGAEPWSVHGYGLRAALSELLQNAVEHNDRENPCVEVAVTPLCDTDQLEVRITDNGPGISEDVATMLHQGEETPLRHGNRLGLWLVYWIVTLLGGSLSLTNAAADGTTALITLPATPADSPVDDASAGPSSEP